VKRELHLLNRDLGLFNPAGELVVENWRTFKREYNVTRVTMNVLLKRPGEEYFAQAKQVKSKNKKAAEISPYAAEFFKVFLEWRKAFVRPSGDAHYRLYNIHANDHADWPAGAWTVDSSTYMKLGVIDFRYLPGILKEESSTGMPYFYDFMSSLRR
jgi:hypothetical protein